MSVAEPESRLRFRSRIASARSAALGVVVVAAAFLAIGGVFDLAGDAGGKLPSDHGSTFRAVTGITWRQAAAAAHPVTPYVTRAEAGYGAYELLFGVLLLVVAAIPLRRGERWAWWCCWLLVLAFATFASLFGAHDTTNLAAAIAAALLVASALIALRARTTSSSPTVPTTG